jgi:hypothetical protein
VVDSSIDFIVENPPLISASLTPSANCNR